MSQLVVSAAAAIFVAVCFLTIQLKNYIIVKRFRKYKKRYIRSLRNSFQLRTARAYIYAVFLLVHSKQDLNLRMRMIRREMKTAGFLFMPVNDRIQATNLDYLEDFLKEQTECDGRVILPFLSLLLSSIAVVIASLRSPDGLPSYFEQFILTILAILLISGFIRLARITRKKRELSIIEKIRSLK